MYIQSIIFPGANPPATLQVLVTLLIGHEPVRHYGSVCSEYNIYATQAPWSLFQSLI